MGDCVVRPQFERLRKVGLRRAQPPGAVFGQPRSDKAHIDPCALDQRFDIVRIEIEGAVEVGTRFVEMLGGPAFVVMGEPEEIMIHRIGVRGARRASCLGGGEFLPEPVGEA
jgi:hypothetical protein